MKKNRTLLLILLTLAFLVPALVACGGGENENESEGGTPAEYLYLVQNGTSDYQIVLNQDATVSAKNAGTNFVKRVQQEIDFKFERVTDDTKKYSEKGTEILLGVSGRATTTEVLGGLGDVGYTVEFKGDKLCIVGTHDYMVEKALDELFANHIVFEEGAMKIDKNIKLTYDGTNDMIKLVDDEGKFLYAVTYSVSATSDEMKAASNLRTTLKNTFNCTRVDLNMDTKTPEYEILIGKTNREESTQLFKEISLMEMRSQMVGTKIVVGAGMDDKLPTAISYLNAAMKEVANGTYNGKAYIPKTFMNVKMIYDWLDGVPTIKTGKNLGVDDIGDNSVVMLYEELSKADYDNYLAALDEAGFVKKQDYKLGENLYSLYAGDGNCVYVSWLPLVNRVRIFVEKGMSSYPALEAEAFETEAGYEPTLWQLSVDNKGAKANGGASYVMKLADGSFIIIDGGYDTEVEADRIYNHLLENSDGEIVISAWFITHQHGDHYGALQAFTPKYKDKVTVKGFYFNFCANDHGVYAMEGSLSGLMRQYKGAVLYRKLHSGMRFNIVNAQFDIIFSQEDLYPLNNTNVNDTSLVMRMTFGGQRVMFLADAEERASRIMETTIDPAEMKSDIVQYAHHGWEGISTKLYDRIAAPTILWSINTYSWQTNEFEKNIFKSMITGNGRISGNMYMAHEATYVKKIFIDEEPVKLVLPYTPTGDKLPDYDRMYNEIYAKEHEND